MTPKIPGIIMQTWKDETIPYHWLKSPESIKKVMKEWKYILMTDQDMEDFVSLHFPDFYPYYMKFPYHIQRCDSFRYMWLYKVGGIYCDLDFEIVESLETLLDQYENGEEREAYIALSGNNNNWYTNSFLASKPKCKIWLECLEEIKKNCREGLPWWVFGKHLEVMYSAGPGMLTKVLGKTKIPFCTVASKDITPCTVCEMPCTKEGAYVRQLCGGSWYAWDTVIYNFVFCRIRYILLAIVVIIIIAIIVYYYVRKKRAF
jgi:mannosyltransferase OCH1-like enzyme